MIGGMWRGEAGIDLAGVAVVSKLGGRWGGVEVVDMVNGVGGRLVVDGACSVEWLVGGVHGEGRGWWVEGKVSGVVGSAEMGQSIGVVHCI